MSRGSAEKRSSTNVTCFRTFDAVIRNDASRHRRSYLWGSEAVGALHKQKGEGVQRNYNSNKKEVFLMKFTNENVTTKIF